MSQPNVDGHGYRLELEEDCTVEVQARDTWSRDRVEVKAGEVYALSAQGGWRSGRLACGPEGQPTRNWLLDRLRNRRRVPYARWLALVGALNQDDRATFVVGNKLVLTVPRDGTLRFFANDVSWLRAGRSGSLRLSVTRLDPSRGRRAERRAHVYPRWLAELESALVAARREAACVPRDGGRVGFALSGGGIRSATFCLGLFQTLARRHLVRNIDFLSTVSGGGYFGGFLGALFARRETKLPGEQQGASRAEVVEHALADSSSKPVHRLRQNGRYLSPAGVGDLLLAAAVQLRNLISLHVIIGVAAVTAVFGLVAARRWLDNLRQALFAAGRVPVWSDGAAGFSWSPWVAVALVPILFAAVPAGWAYWLTQRTRRGRPDWAPAVTTAVIAAGGLTLGFRGRVAVNHVLGWDATWAIRGLAAVAVLALMFWGLAELHAWVANRANASAEDGSGALDDLEFKLLLVRNQLSRVTKLGAVLAAGLVVVGVIDSLGQSLYAEVAARGLWNVLARPSVWPPLAAVLAAIAAMRQFASVLPVQERLRVPWQAAAWVAATIVVTVLATVWAAAAYAFVWAGGPAEGPLPYGRATVGLLAGLVLCWALGRAMQFVNNSSAHALYAARLTRAYLGASNPKRGDDHGTRVSDVVKGDAIAWRSYRPDMRGGPAHIVNVTINETIGGRDQIEYRDRKGLEMALGPVGVSIGARHHATWGSGPDASVQVQRPQPEDARDQIEETFHPLFGRLEREHEVQARQVGHWVAISGAAFTTGLGSRTSLPLALLLGLANVRLGYWWDSHTRPGTHAREAAAGLKRRVMTLVERLFPVQTALVDELLARFWGPAKTYWYLSDGGHFENTGCYELIRRKLPIIVCCDCGADPEYAWTDLANLVRKARIDFGAEIRFLERTELDCRVRPDRLADVCEPREIVAPWTSRDGDREGPAAETHRWARAHAVIARVRYLDTGAGHPENAETGESEESLLLIVKPSLTGDEPADVLEYARSHPSFPHESTLDQYFDEAQWESYRRLGEHVGEKLFRRGTGWFPVV